MCTSRKAVRGALVSLLGRRRRCARRRLAPDQRMEHILSLHHWDARFCVRTPALARRKKQQCHRGGVLVVAANVPRQLFRAPRIALFDSSGATTSDLDQAADFDDAGRHGGVTAAGRSWR
jgi:hypothetical protein